MQIFVERKTHREDWTGEKSVKARFAIAEHKANDFIEGRLTMDDEFDELVKKGKKTVKEVDSMKQLANEVQYAILTRGLKPGECRMSLQLLVLVEADCVRFFRQSCDRSTTEQLSSCLVMLGSVSRWIPS